VIISSGYAWAANRLAQPIRQRALRPVLRSLTSLFSAVAILFVGSGLLGVLIPIRAQIEGFPTIAIGALGTAYYVGFVAGCMYGPRMIHRVGHVRTFAALAAIAASGALAHAMLEHIVVWIALRGLLGFCFAGLYMVIESWLNGGADNHIRGRLLSIYMVVNMAGLAAGKMLLAISEPSSFLLFGVATICISLALVPVSLTRSIVPSPPEHVTLRLDLLYRTAPIGVVGCLAVGMTNGAFWSLGPVFADARFISISGVALFMSVVVVGAMAGQWPLGWLSDRIDRRYVIALGCLAAAVAAVALARMGATSPSILLIASFTFGVAALPIYSICVAHANDYGATEDFVEISSGLLLLFGVGAIVGPFAASLVMSLVGPSGVFLFTAPVHVALAGFAVWRTMQRARPPAEERTVFKEVPPTSPALYELDPRAVGATTSRPSSAMPRTGS
jgi:MFS family permease